MLSQHGQAHADLAEEAAVSLDGGGLVARRQRPRARRHDAVEAAPAVLLRQDAPVLHAL